MAYTLVYLVETDGEIAAIQLPTFDAVADWIRDKKLLVSELYLIGGPTLNVRDEFAKRKRAIPKGCK
jgi:hypothetical protein